MSKLLLDSNIIIGIGKGRFPFSFLKDSELLVSEITRLEVLGYHKLKDQEEQFLNQFFGNITCLKISKEIIDQAIKYRKQKKMSVGDAIIAATAIVHTLPLATANSKDFKHLNDLKMIDP